MVNIELRSEKTQRIIGEIPPQLVRTGTTILTLVILCLIIAVCSIHYPMTIEANGVALNNRVIVMDLPYKHLWVLSHKRKCTVKLEGSDTTTTATVRYYDTQLITKQGENYFEAFAEIEQQGKMQPGQKATISIVLSDKTLLQLLIH